MTTVQGDKSQILLEKDKLGKQFNELLQEEKRLKEEELGIRKCDNDIERENQIVQHNLKEIQEERKGLVAIQDQLNYEFEKLKPSIQITRDELEKLR